MSTARFLVSVSGTQPNPCRIERTLKRAAEDRAVLYAQKWLIDVDKTCRWFGVILDTYHVYKQDETGEWSLWEEGDLADAQMGWTRARTPRSKKVPADSTSETSSPRSAARKSTKARSNTRVSRTGTEFGYEVDTVPRSQYASFRLRMAAANEIAKQTLAAKRAAQKQ